MEVAAAQNEHTDKNDVCIILYFSPLRPWAHVGEDHFTAILTMTLRPSCLFVAFETD
jgi:hypothetical protein